MDSMSVDCGKFHKRIQSAVKAVIPGGKELDKQLNPTIYVYAEVKKN